VNAKRLGVRQPSGALERGNRHSECRRGNGARGEAHEALAMTEI
jgi:hypothetical protein